MVTKVENIKAKIEDGMPALQRILELIEGTNLEVEIAKNMRRLRMLNKDGSASSSSNRK